MSSIEGISGDDSSSETGGSPVNGNFSDDSSSKIEGISDSLILSFSSSNSDDLSSRFKSIILSDGVLAPIFFFPNCKSCVKLFSSDTF